MVFFSKIFEKYSRKFINDFKTTKFTDQLYKEHLKKALVDSKIEFETQKV